MRLIVTEKDNSAKKIAQILSERQGQAGQKLRHSRTTAGKRATTATVVIGLKGHLMNPAFPEGYSEWRKVEPRELIDAR